MGKIVKSAGIMSYDLCCFRGDISITKNSRFHQNAVRSKFCLVTHGVILFVVAYIVFEEIQVYQWRHHGGARGGLAPKVYSGPQSVFCPPPIFLKRLFFANMSITDIVGSPCLASKVLVATGGQTVISNTA